MFVPPEFWRLFGLPDGPGVLWVAAEPLLVLVLPAAALLAAMIPDFWRGDR